MAALVAVGVTALALAARLFLLVDRYAVNIFFSDQWEFNVATVFGQHSLLQVFAWQHGPHRQGVSGLLAKLIEPHFQWNSRIESFVIAGILVIAMLLAVVEPFLSIGPQHWVRHAVLGAFLWFVPMPAGRFIWAIGLKFPDFAPSNCNGNNAI